MRRTNRFQRAGRGVFKCVICTRNTRLAGQGNDRLCPECWELAGLENTVLDGAGSLAEVARERDYLLTKAIKQGSDGERIRADFRTLFPTQEGELK